MGALFPVILCVLFLFSSAFGSNVILFPNEPQCFYLTENNVNPELRSGDSVRIKYVLKPHRGNAMTMSNIELTMQNSKQEIIYKSGIEGIGEVSLTMEETDIYKFCAKVIREGYRSRGIRGAYDAHFSVKVKKQGTPDDDSNEINTEEKILEKVTPLMKRIRNRTQFIKRSQNEADKTDRNVDAADYRNYKSIPYLAILDILIYAGTAAFVTFRIIRFFKLKKVA